MSDYMVKGAVAWAGELVSWTISSFPQYAVYTIGRIGMLLQNEAEYNVNVT